MKRTSHLVVVALGSWAALTGVAQQPLGTALTYQGVLKQTPQPNPPATSANLQFYLYDSATGGTQIGMPVFVPNQAIAPYGIFTSVLNAANEFGPNAFNGNRRWLAVSVNGGLPLSPRQELMVTPYAQFALNAPWTGLTGVPPVALLNSAQTFTARPTFSAGITTNGFTLSSSPQAGKVLTSDASGNGTWQPLSPTQIPTPLTLSASIPGSHVLRGQNTATGASTIGVRGDGVPGVWGFATTSNSEGVIGSATGGVGVFGWCQGATTGTAVWAQTEGTNDGTTGVVGTARGASGNTIGGYFTVDSPSGTALLAQANNTGWAGRFFAGGVSGNGVYISAPNVGLQVAVGTKSAVVRTADGARALYCEEATEVFFADYGAGQLEGGRAIVLIDPKFGETVSLDETYRVFVQPEGECEGVYVANKTATKFEVVELRGGQSNAPFSYRLVAKRRGYEKTRMERAPQGDDDPNLFPEKRAAWEAKVPAALSSPSNGMAVGAP